MADLFADQEPAETAVTPPDDTAPLADRLRPRALDDVVGQEHLTGPDGAIGRMVGVGKLSSMILWGPPVTGKTTIARLLAAAVGLRFVAVDRKRVVERRRVAVRVGVGGRGIIK